MIRFLKRYYISLFFFNQFKIYQISDLGQFRLLKRQIFRQKTEIKLKGSLGETQRDKHDVHKYNINIRT